jgi:endonuclease/exonuclease/phosphatase family metal-dependent hydrolase
VVAQTFRIGNASRAFDAVLVDLCAPDGAGLGNVRVIRGLAARLPILAIDHVFVSAGVKVQAVSTPLDPVSRIASDHLPLVVDFSLSG